MAEPTLVGISLRGETDKLYHPTKEVAQAAVVEVFLHMETPGDCRGFGWDAKGSTLWLWYLGDTGWEPTGYSTHETAKGWVI